MFNCAVKRSDSCIWTKSILTATFCLNLATFALIAASIVSGVAANQVAAAWALSGVGTVTMTLSIPYLIITVALFGTERSRLFSKALKRGRPQVTSKFEITKENQAGLFTPCFELGPHIFSYIGASRDHMAMSMTCKHFYNLIHQQPNLNNNFNKTYPLYLKAGRKMLAIFGSHIERPTTTINATKVKNFSLRKDLYHILRVHNRTNAPIIRGIYALGKLFMSIRIQTSVDSFQLDGSGLVLFYQEDENDNYWQPLATFFHDLKGPYHSSKLRKDLRMNLPPNNRVDWFAKLVRGETCQDYKQKSHSYKLWSSLQPHSSLL